MDTQEARIFAAIIITVIVLGIIIVYFILSIIRQQKRNMELQKKNILAEISAMESERARIAADLHDDLGPILSVIKFQVDHVEAVNADEREQLDKASEYLDSLIARMREIANNLMPSALRRKGFVTAIREYIARVEDAGKLAIDFKYPEGLALSEEKSINLYRTVQELVHNCIKHANATRVTLHVHQNENTLILHYKDDGKGFDYDSISKESNGIGLRSLKGRTEIMGGKMSVESRAGVGSAFLFEIPIK